MVASRFEVRFSRPDEWLRELAMDLEEEAVADNMARIAITHSQATNGDRKPWLRGSKQGDESGPPWYQVRWIQANYVARREMGGQLVKLSGHCGVICSIGEAMANGIGWKFLAAENQERLRASWLKKNRETEDRELELSNLLTAGVLALGVKLRTGNMHGFDPNWRAQDVNEIAAPTPDRNCATCGQPIYHSNEIWRHRNTTSEPYVNALVDDTFGELITHAGREEAWIETVCPHCQGSTKVPAGKGPGQRCDECTMTPGKRRRLHHLADPEIRERKV